MPWAAGDSTVLLGLRCVRHGKKGQFFVFTFFPKSAPSLIKTLCLLSEVNPCPEGAWAWAVPHAQPLRAGREGALCARVGSGATLSCRYSNECGREDLPLSPPWPMSARNGGGVGQWVEEGGGASGSERRVQRARAG